MLVHSFIALEFSHMVNLEKYYLQVGRHVYQYLTSQG